MTSAVRRHDEMFRSAVESGDFAAAEAALQQYIVWFQSGPRTSEDAAGARDLFSWGVRVINARAAQIGGELVRLTRVMDGYRPAIRTHTWRLEG